MAKRIVTPNGVQQGKIQTCYRCGKPFYYADGGLPEAMLKFNLDHTRHVFPCPLSEANIAREKAFDSVPRNFGGVTLPRLKPGGVLPEGHPVGCKCHLCDIKF